MDINYNTLELIKLLNGREDNTVNIPLINCGIATYMKFQVVS